MRSSILLLSSLALAGAQTTGKLGDAKVVTNNPAGASYIAEFNSPKNSVRGSVLATSDPSGTGVHFQLEISGLPAAGGPWNYHLHDQPVPADGNCTGTLAHLDPYQRGQTIACDKSAPQTCEVGDLSGKFGSINSTSASRTFVDKYAALVPGIGAFFGNRSIVIHYANSSRIACANFTVACEDTPTPHPTGGPTHPPTNSTSTPTRPSVPIPTQTGNGAEKLMANSAIIFGLGVAAFLL